MQVGDVQDREFPAQAAGHLGVEKRDSDLVQPEVVDLRVGPSGDAEGRCTADAGEGQNFFGVTHLNNPTRG